MQSLSEYGCNTNSRQFQEVASLYSPEMTSVYSGGLVYEFSEEGSKYGLVTISGSTITEGPDFKALKAAFQKTSNPPGDGGYNPSGGPSKCPSKSANWEVADDSLPAIPSAAAAYMSKGAGKGAGLTGAGSQNAGGTSTGTATKGSGSVSATAKSSSIASAQIIGPADKRPLILAGLTLTLSLFGAILL